MAVRVGSEDAGAALESRWQLKVREADSALKRASFEVTTEGTLRTRSFAIGKTGFHRTSVIDTQQLAVPSASPAAAYTPSTPLPVPPTDRPHLDISEATILEMGLLGRGAGGKVLKSIHRPSLTIIALKCIDVSDKGKRSQLLKELKELDAAYCPHIVAFYGAYYHDLTCTVKLGLEYMNRGSLQAIVHQHGRIHELALTHLVKQTLQGLLHLHANRKLHRDIKPGNILANHFGCAKLSDFGILAELHSSMQKCGTFVGTTIYMSPERLTSEAYSYPADVWSLGMTIITMATGAFPLSTDNGYWGLVMHFNTQPAPTLPDSFSPTFRDFIAKCLVKEPAKRWAVKELLQHPWITLGCEAEEALTYWPAGARMFEPDSSVVKKQREERLEKARKWEEAEEKKKARKGLRNRTSVIKEEQAQERKEAADREAEGGSDDDDGNGRVRHRRKRAIANFHPVGLLHLRAEAHVQNARKGQKSRQEEEVKVADSLYGDGSDDDEGDGAAANPAASTARSRTASETTAPGLTARSRKALAALPGSSSSSSSSSLPSASRPRGLSAAKLSSSEQSGQDGVDKATPLMPVTSPKRGSCFLQHSPSPPSSDYNPLSPSRAARHLKFAHGQVVASAQHSSSTPSFSASPSTSPVPVLSSLSSAVVGPEQGSSSTADAPHDGSSVTLPRVQGSTPPTESPSGPSVATSYSSLPALTLARYGSSGSPPAAASKPSSSPLFIAAAAPNGRARLQGLAPLSLVEAPLRERAQTAGFSSASAVPSGASTLAPLPSSFQPLSAGLPVVHRGSPTLHRRSPSVPAASPGESPASASPHLPSSPQAQGGEGQRRGLRARRPSAVAADGAALQSTGPSSRSVIKLPSLQTTPESTATAPLSAPPSLPTPVESLDSQRDSSRQPPSATPPQKGMRRRMSSISASLASSDLPPVTPVHLHAFSSAAPFTSPLLPVPLSPRSARLLTIISQGEMDDVHIVLQALLDRYREREQLEREAEKKEEAQQYGGGAVDRRPSISANSSPDSSHSIDLRPRLSLEPSQSSATTAADGGGSRGDSAGSDTPSACSTPPLAPSAVSSGGWPSWLPDESDLQEDLDRVADQLGIRVTLIAHALRKILVVVT